MSKKPSIAQWLVLGCGALLVVTCISVSLIFRSVSKNWDNQLATLIATNDNIAAFGDGSHPVSISPNDVLKIGETSTVFGVEITLDNAGFAKSAEYTSGQKDYWFVEFTGKSISDEIQYGVNPVVESQLQYLQNGNYILALDEFEQRQCDYGHVIDGLETGESFHCRLFYLVPADERNLYWVYARTDNVADGSYEERSVAFQIR